MKWISFQKLLRKKPGTITVTSRMTGAFRDDVSTRREFLSIIKGKSGDLL